MIRLIPKNWTRLYVHMLVCVLALSLLGACANAEEQPPFHLAEPGEFVVGTKFVRTYTDPSRGNRPITLTVWYPGILPEGQTPDEIT